MITFPREFPSGISVHECEFRLKRFTNINTSRDGSVEVQEYSDPKWNLYLKTNSLDADDFQTLSSWIMTLKGGAKFFTMFDASRPYPREYRGGFAGLHRPNGTAFSGTANVSGLTSTTITVSDLPNGFKVRTGDYIGLVEGDRYAVHAAIEDVTASGGNATVPVEPLVLTDLFSSAATATFCKARAKFLLLEWDGGRRMKEQSPVTLEAVQVIL
ncbi:hypothetical protein [Roseibium sp. RKSG952]|uniref:hypothetical protein n=1 Tax=Roseibium sp. RKSG952 TaxID=2529384 RepID=UPI0012BC324A|nr:hypothetical protein [Roseibium sp. RKSG952]MTH96427.1 hypothetical protein [Roseibium sp. RKSG952]